MLSFPVRRVLNTEMIDKEDLVLYECRNNNMIVPILSSKYIYAFYGFTPKEKRAIVYRKLNPDVKIQFDYYQVFTSLLGKWYQLYDISKIEENECLKYIFNPNKVNTELFS